MEEGRARRRCAASHDDEAVVSDSFASSHGLKVGDRFRLLSQTRPRPAFGVAGELDSKLDVFGSVLVTQAAIAGDFRQTQDTTDFVKMLPGADPAKTQALLTTRAETAFPTAEV